MTLVVHIPRHLEEGFPHIGLLAQTATDSAVEHDGREQVRVAVYRHFPEGLEAALNLVAEGIRIPGVWATMDGRRMSSLLALWNRLDCYRQSLTEPDVRVYCRTKAANHFAAQHCTGSMCVASCQFLCRQCDLIDRYEKSSALLPQAQVLAVLGEVDWCPSLIKTIDAPR